MKYYRLTKNIELSQNKVHQYKFHSALKYVHHIISLTTPYLQNNDISLIDKHNNFLYELILRFIGFFFLFSSKVHKALPNFVNFTNSKDDCIHVLDVCSNKPPLLAS